MNQPTTADLGTSLNVHSIETFGTHDGPGIRLVVFVQGCQFRCLYCANPDTLNIEGGIKVPLEEILKKAKSQRPYFGADGGVTISGGEPLLQRKVLTRLFQQLHAEGIHTALDSNGRLLDQAAKRLLGETDLLLLDIKHIDDEVHHRLTSLSNETSLRVAAYREETGKPMWLRYVLVPGWTDHPDHLHRLGQHFASYKTIDRLEIQPFHQLGRHKWELLGKDYQLGEVPPASPADVAKASDILSQYFNEVVAN